MDLESLKLQLIKKAWSDPAFKEALLADPKSAIKSELGIDVPSGIAVTAVEETPDNLYLVVPPNPEDAANAKSSTNSVWN
ncbi:NHLP leader peptide family natural product precursor [Cohnella xylanilytica]|uniref:NHLP leader peptide family natural product n=1 Tax=Cohnella xylanilytica TaxID=557555 RepID=A0A841U755_9BACL|nr:NHLP leader peptide family RiPP precursor [Cohnella xylanilytica]MBB6693810.1 NHLP leader peptide family natural product precursor [Cohnella xylanilytica]